MPLESIVMDPFLSMSQHEAGKYPVCALINFKVNSDHIVVRNPWLFVVVVILIFPGFIKL